MQRNCTKAKRVVPHETKPEPEPKPKPALDGHPRVFTGLGIVARVLAPHPRHAALELLTAVCAVADAVGRPLARPAPRI